MDFNNWSDALLFLLFWASFRQKVRSYVKIHLTIKTYCSALQQACSILKEAIGTSLKGLFIFSDHNLELAAALGQKNGLDGTDVIRYNACLL